MSLPNCIGAKKGGSIKSEINQKLKYVRVRPGILIFRGVTVNASVLTGPSGLSDAFVPLTGLPLSLTLAFVFAGFAIFVSAEPFAESLVSLGRASDFDEFLLVQWAAPLASESPEFVVALIFAWKLRGSMAIGALISSKVNQWTLLVGAIPIAYALSLGALEGLPLDARQSQELWLTSAQSLLAAILLADLRFGRSEAILLASLFFIQLIFPWPAVRMSFIALYLLISAYLLFIRRGPASKAFFDLLLARPHVPQS